MARFAFRRATRFGCSMGLVVPTLLLGATLRLAALWPVLGLEGSAGPSGNVPANLVFPSMTVALYAGVLPLVLDRRPTRGYPQSIATAALWVLLGQAPRSFFGLLDSASLRRAFLGLDWTARFALGVVVPFLVASVALLVVARRAKRAPVSGVSARRVLSAVLVTMAMPVCAVFLWVGLWFASVLFEWVNPYLVTVTRTPDGSQVMLSERADDPYDVDLWIQRPGESWTRLPLVRDEPQWSGRIDVTAHGTTATISAYDIVVATVDWRTGAVTRIAPMTWFHGDSWR
jgi:hypothetical protein